MKNEVANLAKYVHLQGLCIFQLVYITEISKTLIDLILTNRPEYILSTGAVHFGIYTA